jgi:hypothetical protein
MQEATSPSMDCGMAMVVPSLRIDEEDGDSPVA